MYQIIGGDGKEYGPISEETIKQWIAEGRLNANTQVRREGGADWKSLADFPELKLPPSPVPRPGPVPVSNAGGQTSSLAVMSLVLGVLGCLGITALAGLICGIVALVKINRSEGQLRGSGLAIGGICVSGLMLLLAVPFMAMFGAMTLPAFSQAREKAMSISCVNNMKQIGLGVRIYSGDHNDTLPPDLLSISNELGTPFILICPADKAHPRPTSGWLGLTTNSISYEYLTPGAYESNVVNQVILRCPVHGHVGMGDGAVIQDRSKSTRH